MKNLIFSKTPRYGRDCCILLITLFAHLLIYLLLIFIYSFTLFFQVEKIVTIMSNPRQYKIPDWFLNRQKDIKDGKYSQVSLRQLNLYVPY